jgi:hypothetical protein
MANLDLRSIFKPTARDVCASIAAFADIDVDQVFEASLRLLGQSSIAIPVRTPAEAV